MNVIRDKRNMKWESDESNKRVQNGEVWHY